jgi:hypothetical protein
MPRKLDKKCRSRIPSKKFVTVASQTISADFFPANFLFRFPLPTQLVLLCVFTPLSSVLSLGEVHHVR